MYEAARGGVCAESDRKSGYDRRCAPLARAASLEEAIGSMRECPELSSPPSDSEEGRVPFLRSLAKLKESKAKKLVIGILLRAWARTGGQ